MFLYKCKFIRFRRTVTSSPPIPRWKSWIWLTLALHWTLSLSSSSSSLWESQPSCSCGGSWCPLVKPTTSYNRDPIRKWETSSKCCGCWTILVYKRNEFTNQGANFCSKINNCDQFQDSEFSYCFITNGNNSLYFITFQ